MRSTRSQHGSAFRVSFFSRAAAFALAAGLAAAPTWAGEPEKGAPESAPAAGAPAETAALTPDRAIELLSPFSKRPEGAEFDAAAAVIADAASKEPKRARWQYGLALVARARADRAASPEERQPHAQAYKKHAEQAATLDPANADHHFEHGQSFMYSIDSKVDGFMTMAGKAGDAKDQWEKGIKANPDHMGCRIALAQYEIQARKQGGMLFGSYKAAKKHAEHLLKVKGAEHQGHMLLGQIASEQEEWDEMEAQFASAERIAKAQASIEREAEVLASRASALLNAKKDAKAAMPVIERLVAISPPDSFTPFFMRGSARKLQGDCPGAIADFELVLSRNPDAQNTRFLMAECLEATGNKQAALDHYRQFVQRFPSSPRVAAANKAIKKLEKAVGGASG